MYQHLYVLIDAVDTTTALIATIASSAASSAANDLVRARWVLTDEGLAMSRAIDDLLGIPLASLDFQTALMLKNAYYERRNQARRAIASHQAKWSAIEMRKAMECYRADVERLHFDQQAYRAWLRNEFIPTAAALLENHAS